MLDDGYTVDETGNIQKVDNTGGNKYDVLFNEKDYKNGKRNYDKSGTKNGIQIDRGEIKNIESKKYAVTDDAGGKIGELTRSKCEISNESVADNLLKFLDKNTKVEWSNQAFENSKGNMLNILSTSQEEGSVNGSNELTHKYLDKGWSLKKDDHNHPVNINKNKPSNDRGDKVYKKEFLQRCPNAKFRILYQGRYSNY